MDWVLQIGGEEEEGAGEGRMVSGSEVGLGAETGAGS